MLALTPEVLDVFRWFELTHEVTGTMGAAWWHMVRLPREGAVGDQDARLMAALEFARHLENELLHEQVKKGDPGAELRKFRESQKTH